MALSHQTVSRAPMLLRNSFLLGPQSMHSSILNFMKEQLSTSPLPALRGTGFSRLGDSPFNVDPLDLSSPDDPLFPSDSYTATDNRPLPDWIKANSKVTLSVDGFVRTGSLTLADDLLWNFVQRDKRGLVCF